MLGKKLEPEALRGHARTALGHIDKAQPALEPMARRAPTRNDALGPTWSGQAVHLGLGLAVATPVICRFAHRLPCLLQMPDVHFEPLTVLRLGVGDGRADVPSAAGADAAPPRRRATAFLQLIATSDGGEHACPAAGLVVEAPPGTLLVHHAVTPDEVVYRRAAHTVRPMRAGEQWLACVAVGRSPDAS